MPLEDLFHCALDNYFNLSIMPIRLSASIDRSDNSEGIVRCRFSLQLRLRKAAFLSAGDEIFPLEARLDRVWSVG